MVTARKDKTIIFPIEDTFVHEYQLRKATSRKDTVEVSVPRDFVRRLAKRAELSYDEYIKGCRVTVYYGGGNDLLYHFNGLKSMGASPEDVDEAKVS